MGFALEGRRMAMMPVVKIVQFDKCDKLTDKRR